MEICWKFSHFLKSSATTLGDKTTTILRTRNIDLGLEMLLIWQSYKNASSKLLWIMDVYHAKMRKSSKTNFALLDIQFLDHFWKNWKKEKTFSRIWCSIHFLQVEMTSNNAISLLSLFWLCCFYGNIWKIFKFLFSKNLLKKKMCFWDDRNRNTSFLQKNADNFAEKMEFLSKKTEREHETRILLKVLRCLLTNWSFLTQKKQFGIKNASALTKSLNKKHGIELTKSQELTSTASTQKMKLFHAKIAQKKRKITNSLKEIDETKPDYSFKALLPTLPF